MAQIIDHPPQENFSVLFRKRSCHLLIFLSLFGAAGVLQLFYYSHISGKRLIAESDRIALRQGVIPSPRGKILSSSGKILAWSEIRYDLVCTYSNMHRMRRLSERLAELFPGEKFPFPDSAARTILKKDLSPEMIRRIGKLLSDFPELDIRSVFIRCTTDDVSLKEQIGCVENGHGVSGLEKKYDFLLSGTPGIFQVMFDRRNAWVGRTIRILKAPVSGCDVAADETFSEGKPAK